MLRRRLLCVILWGTAAAALSATVVQGQELRRLPASVTSVVDTSGDLSTACVETNPGMSVRGGWWDSGTPGAVDLCALLAGGTFVDPIACNSNDAATIVGAADGGVGGHSQVPVLCRTGTSTQLTRGGLTFFGEAQCVNPTGTRAWGYLQSAGLRYPFLWRDDDTLVFDPPANAYFTGNFFFVTDVRILDCSDDGQRACGWYEWNGDGNRWPFVIDLGGVSNFEDCFGGNTQLHQGEARCMSADGSRVYVYRFDNDRTYQTNSSNPEGSIDVVATGQPLYCSDDGTRVVGYTTDGGVDVGWIWKQGVGQSDLATVNAYDGLRPSCFDATGKHVGGVLQDGVDAGGLWRDNKFDGFPAIRAARDSLNKQYANYSFSNVVAISQDGRTFYCDGESGGTDRWFYCELSDQKQFVWKEKSRGGWPALISEYSYYAYYYCVLAASGGGSSNFSLAQAYGEAALNLDPACRNVKYDYWQGKDARKTYQNLRNQQYLYEYYCYVYAYYGQLGAPSTNGAYAQAYANYAQQFILEDL